MFEIRGAKEKKNKKKNFAMAFVVPLTNLDSKSFASFVAMIRSLGISQTLTLFDKGTASWPPSFFFVKMRRVKIAEGRAGTVVRKGGVEREINTYVYVNVDE